MKITAINISNYYNTRTKVLDLTSKGITKIMYIPVGCIEIYANDNQIDYIVNLPANVEFLDCSDNRLYKLPKFNDKLQEVYCDNNVTDFKLIDCKLNKIIK